MSEIAAELDLLDHDAEALAAWEEAAAVEAELAIVRAQAAEDRARAIRAENALRRIVEKFQLYRAWRTYGPGNKTRGCQSHAKPSSDLAGAVQNAKHLLERRDP